MTSPFAAAAFPKSPKSTTKSNTQAAVQAPAQVAAKAPVPAPARESETTCRLCGQEAAGHCPGLDAGKHFPCSPRMLQMISHLPAGDLRLKARAVINGLGKGRCFSNLEAEAALKTAGLGSGNGSVQATEDEELRVLNQQAEEAEAALAALDAEEAAAAAALANKARLEAAKQAAAERIAAAVAALAARRSPTA